MFHHHTDAESYLYDESKSIRPPIKPSDLFFFCFSLRNSYHLPFIYLFLYIPSPTNKNIEKEKLSFVVARFLFWHSFKTIGKRIQLVFLAELFFI